MNAERRKTIKDVITRLQGYKWDDLANYLDALKTDLEGVTEEEQSAFDNMPESMQNGEKGSAMQEGLDILNAAVDAIQSAWDSVNDASGQVEESITNLESIE